MSDDFDTSHKHEFPVQPPEGSWLNPGPCRRCGKTWALEQAEKDLADAQAALAAAEASRGD